MPTIITETGKLGDGQEPTIDLTDANARVVEVLAALQLVRTELAETMTAIVSLGFTREQIRETCPHLAGEFDATSAMMDRHILTTPRGELLRWLDGRTDWEPGTEPEGDYGADAEAVLDEMREVHGAQERCIAGLIERGASPESLQWHRDSFPAQREALIDRLREVI